MLSAATTSRRALLFARTIRPTTVVPAASRASSASASAAPSPDAAPTRPVEIEFNQKYIVERTSNGQLPVYSDFKNGNSQRTVVRRIKGNVLVSPGERELRTAIGGVALPLAGCVGQSVSTPNARLAPLHASLRSARRALADARSQALRQDLANYLADGHIDPITKPPKVIIKPVSGQVEVKGRWVEEVKGWLEMRGF